jgi:hypothetical protein
MIIEDERIGTKLLQFEIRHGHYNGLREQGDSKTLLLTTGSFIEGLYELSKVFPYEAIESSGFNSPPGSWLTTLQKVTFKGRESKQLAFRPHIPIGLTSQCSVLHLSGRVQVMVAVEIFAFGALQHLSFHPELPSLVGWTADFRESFAAAWAELTKKSEDLVKYEMSGLASYGIGPPASRQA